MDALTLSCKLGLDCIVQAFLGALIIGFKSQAFLVFQLIGNLKEVAYITSIDQREYPLEYS